MRRNGMAGMPTAGPQRAACICINYLQMKVLPRRGSFCYLNDGAMPICRGGVYLYSFSTDQGFTQTRKLLLIK